MKIIKQNKLLSSILTSDILYYTNNNSKKKTSNFYLNKIKVQNKSEYILLNVIFFLQNLKQMIRLLQYNLKYYKNFLQIVTSNNLYNQMIEYVSKTYSDTNSKLNARSKFNNKLNSKMLIFIQNDSKQNLDHLIRKAFFNNINSILLINSYFNKNIFGNYKVFTDVNNYKKLLFILMIILLAQKKIEKKLKII